MNPSDTTYIIRSHSEGYGEYIVETKLPYGRKEVLDDIRNGHVEGIVSIYAITPSMGSCRDATKDIAETLYQMADAEFRSDYLTYDAIEFLRANGQEIDDLMEAIETYETKAYAAAQREDAELRGRLLAR
jgi:hypothetical protein